MVLARIVLLAGSHQIDDVLGQRQVGHDQLTRTARAGAVGGVASGWPDIPAREKWRAVVALERHVRLHAPPRQRVRAGDLQFVQEGHVELALVAEVIVGLRLVVGVDQRRDAVARLIALDRVATHVDDAVDRPAAEELRAAIRALNPSWTPL